MGGGNLCINMLGGGPEGGGRWPGTKPGGGPAGGGKGPSSAELGPARQPCSCALSSCIFWPGQQRIVSDDLPLIEIYRDTVLLVEHSWTG